MPHPSPALPSLAAIACAIALATAPAGAQKRSAASQRDPATLYHDHCSVCHGDRGDARSRARNALDPPPRDFTSPDAPRELSRARMILAVKEGRPGTAMVGWKTQLDDAQIASIVDYVRETFMRMAVGDASRGRQIYMKTCAVCHGDRGQGSAWAAGNMRPPPRDFTGATARAELTRDRMIASVTHGRPGTAMAAFSAQLSPADIVDVVDYVQSAFVQPGATAVASAAHPSSIPSAATAASVDMKAVMPLGLAGAVSRGKRLYDANCAACHGVGGAGDGPRAYFIYPRPRSFVSQDTRRRFNRVALFTSVSIGRSGTEMPAWNKVLEPQQIADVVEYVFQSFVQPAGTLARAKER